jgi:hypothetical protein
MIKLGWEGSNEVSLGPPSAASRTGAKRSASTLATSSPTKAARFLRPPLVGTGARSSRADPGTSSSATGDATRRSPGIADGRRRCARTACPKLLQSAVGSQSATARGHSDSCGIDTTLVPSSKSTANTGASAGCLRRRLRVCGCEYGSRGVDRCNHWRRRSPDQRR